jgi:hypothetical protein
MITQQGYQKEINKETDDQVKILVSEESKYPRGMTPLITYYDELAWIEVK